MTTGFRGLAFVTTAFLIAFFPATGLREAAAFFGDFGFTLTFGLLALRAGAFAVTVFGFGRTDFAFNARFFVDFTVVRRPVVRVFERLRPFARVLMD